MAGIRKNDSELTLVAPLQQSTAGGSGAFLGLANDQHRYWIKTLNNLHSPRVPTNEQIVGRAARLIGGPGCEIKTIAISADCSGWEFRPGRALEAGIAHACSAVPDCSETRALAHRGEDENSTRHAMIFALYDWCWGSDPQWLVAQTEEQRYYSHDHGHYFPGGPNWTVGSLMQYVDQPNEFADSFAGISTNAVRSIAEALESLTKESLACVLAGIPSSWPVTDEELECIGFFLQRRAPRVASRLRARFGVAS